MYALAIVRYRIPIADVDEIHREAHRNYLRELKGQGLLIASGPFEEIENDETVRDVYLGRR